MYNHTATNISQRNFIHKVMVILPERINPETASYFSVLIVINFLPQPEKVRHKRFIFFYPARFLSLLKIHHTVIPEIISIPLNTMPERSIRNNKPGKSVLKHNLSGYTLHCHSFFKMRKFPHKKLIKSLVITISSDFIKIVSA
ncbi:hypothetical protein [Citrobacter koseri]|uniref:hypothetical protein n=1 Tax=Citrobacter koseri TaxID=545 RepID=UPI003891DE7B